MPNNNLQGQKPHYFTANFWLDKKKTRQGWSVGGWGRGHFFQKKKLTATKFRFCKGCYGSIDGLWYTYMKEMQLSVEVSKEHNKSY